MNTDKLLIHKETELDNLERNSDKKNEATRDSIAVDDWLDKWTRLNNNRYNGTLCLTEVKLEECTLHSGIE